MNAVFFDMDGVLVDSERYWSEREATVIVPEAVADPDPDPELITGINYRESYDVLADHYEMAIDRAQFLDRYEAVAEDIYTEKASLLAGFDDLYDALRARGVAVGVVSGAPRAWVELVIDHFDLGPFDVVLSTEDLPEQGKPAPHVYEAAAREVGVDPADCLVVEDSENGILAATRAGAFVVGYTTDDSSAADVTVTSPDALRKAIRDRI
jgi:HAD superfamily hydrolase (TIGR01509 family)